MYFALLNGGEIIIILIAILILFGGSRLPQLGDALGRGIRNFRNAIGGGGKKEEEESPETKEEPKKKEPLALPPHEPNKDLNQIPSSEKQKSQ